MSKLKQESAWEMFRRLLPLGQQPPVDGFYERNRFYNELESILLKLNYQGHFSKCVDILLDYKEQQAIEIMQKVEKELH